MAVCESLLVKQINLQNASQIITRKKIALTGYKSAKSLMNNNRAIYSRPFTPYEPTVKEAGSPF